MAKGEDDATRDNRSTQFRLGGGPAGPVFRALAGNAVSRVREGDAVSDRQPRGFTGKVPTRGDFVHAGLPRGFVDHWDDWLATAIAGSREIMGDAWLDAFLEAPVWRFALPPGLCGAQAAVGLIMPSVDKVGRYYPLTFAALADTAIPGPRGDSWTAWLNEAEALGRAALDEDASPDRLMPPPCPGLDSVPAAAHAGAHAEADESAWWTEGGPRVRATSFVVVGLPDPARFASMLGHTGPLSGPLESAA